MAVAIIHKTPPGSNPNGLEALDTAFSLANLEQHVAMFFIHDGVFQLAKGQHPESIGFKNHTKTYPALEFYDIEDIYVCSTSMKERSLSTDNLVTEVTEFDADQLSSLLQPFNQVLTF